MNWDLTVKAVIMNTIISAFNQPLVSISIFQWERLHMTKGERRKIFCSVLFHLIAIVCMLWSVYVLVKRTTEEIRLGKNGEYEPPRSLCHIPETRRVKVL